MVKKYQLSSTEQLLDVIRGTKEILGNSSGDSGVRNASGSRVSMGSGQLDPRKTTVGISCDSTGIRLVALEGGGRKRRIVDYAHIDMQVPEEIDPRVVADRIVKEGYDRRFGLKKSQVWLMLRSEEIDQWTIKIPKKVEGKQESKAAYWAAKAKKKFDDASVIFDYYHIEECTDKGLDKLCLGVFTIPKKPVYAARDGFAKAGIPLAGISSFSLCCPQLFDKAPRNEDDAPLAVIRVDQDWSRIDLFHRQALAFTRRIKTGIESFAVSIQERYQPTMPVAVESGNIELELDLEEDVSGEERLSMDEAMAILENHDSLGDRGESSAVSLSDEAFMELIEPAAQRLVRQLERTFDHFRTSMKVPPLTKLLFVGQIARFEPIVRYIGTQFDMETDVLDPFAAASLSTALPIPKLLAVKTSYAPSVAAALSMRQSTPNFLYNYQAKYLDNQLKKVHRILLAGFLGIALGLGGYFLYNQHRLEVKKNELQTLTRELANYSGEITDDRIRKLLESFKKRNRFLKEYTTRFSPLAVFAEIAKITPSSIRINSLILNSTEDEGIQSITLDGIVTGKEVILDSYLSNYLVMLDDSPLFAGSEIQKQNRVQNGEAEQIRFVLNVRII
jgi:Tfp pilus assembly PilM family ATPase